MCLPLLGETLCGERLSNGAKSGLMGPLQGITPPIPAHKRKHFLSKHMNTNWQAFKLFLTAIAAVVFCCQCKTGGDPEVVTSLESGSKFGKLGKLSEVGMKRQSGYKFSGVNDNELESSGKKSEGAERISGTLKNEKVIKNSKGEVVRKEKRTDLYAERTGVEARETGRSFDGKKQARLKQSRYGKKEFKTPEYLQRQEFAGSKTFKDGSLAANESGSKTKHFVDKMFQTDKSKFQNQSARENGSTNSRFNKTFTTSSDRIASKAFKTSAIPNGVDGMTGYRDNVNLSMDDVKKLVNPASAR